MNMTLALTEQNENAIVGTLCFIGIMVSFFIMGWIFIKITEKGD